MRRKKEYKTNYTFRWWWLEREKFRVRSYRAAPAWSTLSRVMVAVLCGGGSRRTMAETNLGCVAARARARVRAWVGGIECLASEGGVLVHDVVDADKALAIMVSTH